MLDVEEVGISDPLRIKISTPPEQQGTWKVARCYKLTICLGRSGPTITSTLLAPRLGLRTRRLGLCS